MSEYRFVGDPGEEGSPVFTSLDVRTDIDLSPWDDVDSTPATIAGVERIGLLRNGTTRGRASVILLVRLPDGGTVVAQTSWRLFRTACQVLVESPLAAEET